jgi:arabinose-5-phosphate isomerase
MVTGDDIVIALSYTGRTSEINHILPILKSMGAKIIAFTGHADTPMTMNSDIVIDVGVEREACPMGLVPTTSTTATLAMGDALAVALINRRRFDRQDFKRIHPGGGLGERLATKVREVMLTNEHIPRTYLGSKVKEAIMEIEAKGIGVTIIVDNEEKLAGIITDGDLRRHLLKTDNIQELSVDEVMSLSPKTIDEDEKAAEALALMEYYSITHLLVLDRQKRVKGVLHLHDLLGREDFKLNGRTNPTQRPDY